METFTSFPYTFNLGQIKFELEDGRVTWINAQGIESKCSLDGKMQAIKIFDDKEEYVMTVQYPDGIYCISHNGGMFGPFQTVHDVLFDEVNNVPVISGVRGNETGEFPLTRE